MSINRQIPGPGINVCKNDLIVVNVFNKMFGTAVTIHWHGISQKSHPWMDGVPHVTQCPIIGSESFRYTFPAQVSNFHVSNFVFRSAISPNSNFPYLGLRHILLSRSHWNPEI